MVKIGKHGHATRYNIARTRITRGVTYVDLGDRIAAAGGDLTWRQVARIERGDKHLDVDALFAIAEGLDVAPADLLVTDTSCSACHGAPPGELPCQTCCVPPTA